MERDASINIGGSTSVSSSQIISELKTVIPHTSELTTTSETKNNPGPLKDQVEPETKEETNTNNDAVTETDTSATLTANANNRESFKMQQQFQSCMEDSQNTEVVEILETQRTQHMANPPVLHETSSDAVSSIDIASCDEDDHKDKNDQQPKKEDSYEITTPSEVEDQSHTVGDSPLPTLNATDRLCTGIGKHMHNN